VFNIGPAEILVILLIALIVFGPKRLPEIGKTVGKGLREFRKASQDIKDEFAQTMDEDDERPQRSPSDQPPSLDGSAPSATSGPAPARGADPSGEALPGS
jgi:sec-independent protein translocase protein TatA